MANKNQNWKKLYLGENNLSRIEGLENLPNLGVLALFENDISGIYIKKSDIAPFLHPSVDIEKFELFI